MKGLRAVGVLLVAQAAFCAVETFDSDPAQKPEWELYEPVPGPVYSVLDGWWRVTIPAGVNLDTWVSVDRGVQLRRTDMPQDFVAETRIRIVGAGDPDNPVYPPPNESYLANLMVLFSRFDLFHFGPQRGTQLVLQRCGTPHLCMDLDPAVQEVSLQVRKVGSEYTFSWRAEDDQPWEQFCTQIVDEVQFPPQAVGIIFKTWNPPTTVPETFEFDYFVVDEIPPQAPTLAQQCSFGEPDQAYLHMPYVRPLEVTGFPAPDISVLQGPPELSFDSQSQMLSAWIPTTEGTVTVGLQASNDLGVAQASWEVQVSAPSPQHDEEFNEDPVTNPDFWELYEPQRGVTYSIVTDGANSYWRLDVPVTGELGQNFDTWTNADRAPQLRHFLEDPEGNFLIETSLRYDPTQAPAPTAPFLMGLLVYFGPSDIIHLHAGFERTVGGEPKNILLERTGQNNIATDYYPDLLLGTNVSLRLEKICRTYNAFWRGEDEETWHYMGSYETPDLPQALGLVMKTFGAGAAFAVEVDYFDIVEPAGQIPQELFVRGEVNDDGTINIADAVSLLSHLFAGGEEPSCMDAADANDDGGANIADAISILAHLFGGAGALPAPFPDCGPDPTGDDTLPPCKYTHCPRGDEVQ